LIGNSFFDGFSGSGFLFIGVFWILFWWTLCGSWFALFLLLDWSCWVGLGKGGLTGEAWKLIFDWHWGVVNESAISLNFSSNSNSVFIVFTYFVVFLLSGSDFVVALIFESSLLGHGVEDNLEGSSFLTVGVLWGAKSDLVFVGFWGGGFGWSLGVFGVWGLAFGSGVSWFGIGGWGFSGITFSFSWGSLFFCWGSFGFSLWFGFFLGWSGFSFGLFLGWSLCLLCWSFGLLFSWLSLSEFLSGEFWCLVS
jgi:hypothetical protein